MKNDKWKVIAAVAVIVSVGIGFTLAQWQSSRNRQAVLGEIEQLEAEGKYLECVSKANQVPQDSRSYEQAKVLLNSCAEQLLENAQQLAEERKFNEAILQASQLIPGNAYYQKAQNSIRQWSNRLLEEATNLYQEQGKINDAITLIKSIPENTEISQNSQELISQWQEEWAENKDILQEAEEALKADNLQVAKEKASQVTTPYWEKQASLIIQAIEAKIVAQGTERRARERVQAEAERLAVQGTETVEQRLARRETQPEREQSTQQDGTIEGKLSYPSNFLAAQKICAKNLANEQLHCTETKQSSSQMKYTLKLPPGTYNVYAMACNGTYQKSQYCKDGYNEELKAYYNEAVTCGLSVDCKSKKPISVVVKQGQTVTGVDTADWYF
ncbi:MAG: hypothetical protein WA919_21895 [Coleofasciculaceae cyanobacterium]